MSASVPRILVADEDPQTRTMLRHALEHEGFAVETARGSVGVSALVQAGGVDLIVLDVAIGPVDGLTLLAQLHGRPYCPSAIFLSRCGDAATRLRAFELGAVDYVTKPIDPVAFVARIRAAVQLGHPSQRSPVGGTGLEPDPPRRGRPPSAAAPAVHVTTRPKGAPPLATMPTGRLKGRGYSVVSMGQMD